MKASTRARVTATTQEHLEVKEIVDDLVITKNGTVSIVLQTSAVNFDLLSEYEQDNKILAFSGLLNSLNFYIQILIRTKRINISKYVDYLKSREQTMMSEGTKYLLTNYTKFVQNLIVQNDVLDKKFYIIIPYTSVSSTASSINPLAKKKINTDEEEQYSIEKTLEQGKIALYPKRDQIIKLAGRMGLVTHQLTSTELIQLFYDIYNPEE